MPARVPQLDLAQPEPQPAQRRGRVLVLGRPGTVEQHQVIERLEGIADVPRGVLAALDVPPVAVAPVDRHGDGTVAPLPEPSVGDAAAVGDPEKLGEMTGGADVGDHGQRICTPRAAAVNPR